MTQATQQENTKGYNIRLGNNIIESVMKWCADRHIYTSPTSALKLFIQHNVSQLERLEKRRRAKSS